MENETIPLETLLAELREADDRVELIENLGRPAENGNRSSLSNFRIGGRDICQAVLTTGLQTVWTPGYTYVFPNGMSANVKTYDQIKSDCLTLIEKLKDSTYASEFFEIDTE